MAENYFGKILREYREVHHMSQQELADILGTTKQVISRYETGQREPKIKIAQKYADKLDIPLSRLLEGELSISELVAPFTPDSLIQIRKQQGLSPVSAANKCDMEPNVYRDIEDGVLVPTNEQLQQLAIGLNTSLDSLCNLSFYIAHSHKDDGYIQLTRQEYDFIMSSRKLSPGDQNMLFSKSSATTPVDAENKKSTSISDAEDKNIKELKFIYNSLNETGKQQLMIQARQIANFDEYTVTPRQFKHA